MKKLSGLFIFIFIFLSFYQIQAVVQDPKRCLMNIETRFFQAAIVQQALSLYNIPQAYWGLISQDLQQKNLTVPDRMKKKTARMVHNPLEYPMQKAETARILRDTLYEVFMESMNRYNSGEQPTARWVFDYIFNQQLPNLVQCFGPEVINLIPRYE